MALSNKVRKKITRRFDNLESENEYLTQSIRAIFFLLAGAFLILACVVFFYDVLAIKFYLPRLHSGIGVFQWVLTVIFGGAAVWCVRRI